jgi:hypothetical protein
MADPGAAVAGSDATLAMSDAVIPGAEATLAIPAAGPSITGREGEQAASLPEWKQGDTILETYTVKDIFEGGGFGRVYRVHHRFDVAAGEQRKTIAGIPASIELEKSPGFGLQLIGLLTRQLKGTIRLERGTGSRSILEFNV